MIITFDGTLWSKEELEDKAKDDSFYYGYLGKNALSSSSIKSLLDSPQEYLRSIAGKSEDIDAFKFGRLIHEQILEPEVDYNWNIVEAKDKRSKAWKDAVKEDLPNTILKRDWNKCKMVSDSVLANDYAYSTLNGLSKEVPIIGEIDGIPFRGKADAIDLDNKVIVDLKTTGDIKKFNKWTCMSYGYDCQVYIYCTLFNVHWKDFKFLVVDKSTRVIGHYDVTESFYESGKEKTHKAIDLYKKYFVNREEPVYQYLIKGKL